MEITNNETFKRRLHHDDNNNNNKKKKIFKKFKNVIVMKITIDLDVKKTHQ